MYSSVRPKKFLGQHFLRDNNIARKIVDSLTGYGNYTKVLEIGPGTGVLTRLVFEDKRYDWTGVELDRDSIAYLKEQFRGIDQNLLEADFLKIDIAGLADDDQMAILGNFPYNISSQILFKVLENNLLIPELVGMFQKEVALRIAASPGNKTYGILSVLAQAHYKVELLFSVDENVFDPPPKVKSAVIRMQRKLEPLQCSSKKLSTVVKTAFNQRRKTLRNSLKSLDVNWDDLPAHFHGERPEQLSLQDFFLLANSFE